MKEIVLFLICVFLAESVSARGGSERYVTPDEPFILDLRYSNDFPFSTDRYFSNGMEANLFAGFLEKNPLNILFLPGTSGDLSFYSIGFKHHIFTPINIYTAELLTNDRPYAAYLLIGMAKTSYNRDKLLKKSGRLEVGVMGPAAGGGEVQNFAHQKIMTWFLAEGWDNQLSNDFLLNYSMGVEKGLLSNNWFQFMAGGSVRIGQPYTDGSLSAKVSIGKMENYFSGPGISVKKDWQLYLYAGVEQRIVAYNAVLQGGLFNDHDIHVRRDIERNVSIVESGIAFSFKGIKVEVGQILKTPEFSAGRQHNWGYARLQVRF